MTDQEPRNNPLLPGPSPAGRGEKYSDWLLIGVLVALALPLRIWLICNTEVTARDSIGYIRYALKFEQMPWREVLQKSDQHPGYPVLVWLTSLPVRAWSGETTPENMAFSAQLINLIASLLLMAPMYFLGRQFFGQGVSFFGTLLYQYLPISAQLMSDGLSEPAYLAFLVSGLFFMARAFRERNNADSLACGVFTGLAYLTRPEGLLILPAFGLTLIALQLRPAWRGSWRSFLSCGTTMLLATVLVGSVYVYATGHISNKPNVEIMAKKFADASDRPEMGGTSGPLFAATFAPSPDKGTRLLQGTRALATELCQGLHYFAVLPVLLGFWWSFPSLRGHPGFWALATYVGLHGFVLIELAMSAGYISDRHVMILVLLDSFFVVACLRELPIRIQAWLKIDPTPKWTRSAPLWFALLFAALIGACLPKATQRLHGNRAENHAAGKWLAQKVAVEDNVFIGDDHAWSHFYSGLIFQEGSEKPFPRDFESNSYIVVTRTRDAEGAPPRPNARLNSDARPVWPESADVSRARVLVYLQKRVYEEHPWPLRRKED